MSVEWRPVPNWPGYEVSDIGQVRSRGEYHHRPMELSCAPGWGGYPKVTLNHRGRRRTVRVYKLVAEAFLGPCPPGLLVRHRDGNPANSHVENLRYGTPAENEADKIAHGRHPQLNKTHCPQGHPYTPENTGRNTTGRRCLTCHRKRENARYHRGRRREEASA